MSHKKRYKYTKFEENERTMREVEELDELLQQIKDREEELKLFDKEIARLRKNYVCIIF